MAVEILCDECGGSNVTRDAWAAWDLDTQSWVLGAVFDDGHCHDCERDSTLIERVVLSVVTRRA